MPFKKTEKIRIGWIGLVIALWMGGGCAPGEKGGTAHGNGDSALIQIRTSGLRLFEGGTGEVDLRLKNVGHNEWSSRGRDPVFVSYHVLDNEGKNLRFDNARTSLPRVLRPGEEIGLSLRVKAPLDKGDYHVEIDLVREGRAWFKDSGTKTLVIPLLVEEKRRSGETSLESSVPEFNALQKLIRITLENDEVSFPGKTGRIEGFTAGAGYPQIWLRDAATIIPASRFYYPESHLTSWLEEHLAYQKPDGGLEDWIDAQGRSDKNTVETDQEASAVLSAHQVFVLKGKDWLNRPVAGEAVIDRLEKAIDSVFKNRFNSERGLITGAHTADWGDVDPEDPDQQAIYVDEKTRWTADIYDQSMLYESCRRLASMFSALRRKEKADKWTTRAASLRESTNRHLWQGGKGFYRVHIHLDPFPHDFAEDDMFAMGGNAQAIIAGVADAGKAHRIIRTALERQETFGLSTISGSLLPPYPAGFFKHPAMDEPYEYQNGGQWDWFGGRLILAMFETGWSAVAREKLIEIAAKNVRNGGLFEWDTQDGRGRGSDYYAGSAGSLARALYEGYFGLKLGEKSLDLEPRLGPDEGHARIRIPSSGFVAVLDYRPAGSERKILFRYESNFSGRGKVRWLIPWDFFGVSEKDPGRTNLEIRRDGLKVPFSLEKRRQDEYAVIETDFFEHTLEMRRVEPPAEEVTCGRWNNTRTRAAAAPPGRRRSFRR
ncbi:MAG: hypothetical protein JXE07_01230 [Candidatus Aminicenantes bacterium]|nr:hypothetical protein [Candidatus Aminicenantes bacterium]